MTAADALVPPLAPQQHPRLRLVSPSTPLPRTTWWARIDRDPVDGSPVHSLVIVASDRFPGGTAVNLPGADARGRRPAGWLVDVRYRVADGTLVRIDLPGEAAEGLVFTEVHHAAALVPAVSLHAWTGAATHAGEVRWWLRSGLVETVQVEQAFRGRGLGPVLLTAAQGLRLVRGWPPVHTDGPLAETAPPGPGRLTGVARLLADLPTRVV